MPLLSVVIPAYRRAGVIRRAIDSVLRQVDDGVEIVVVDDGSDDGTADAAEAVRDHRVRVLRKPHRGVSAARNIGLHTARGTYVAFLDSDDEVLPGWFEQVRSAAASDVALWSCAVEWHNEDGTVRIETPHRLGAAFGGITALFLAGAFAARRDLLQQVGGYIDGLRHGENTALGMRLGDAIAKAQSRSISDATPLVRLHTRARRYDAALLDESSQIALSAVGALLRRDRATLASYLAVGGVAAARNGRRLAGMRLLLRAWSVQPLQLRHPARLVRATIAPGKPSS